jgi:S-DNA-T family DNA segregation ATPase FtsK/SpoIIIE
VRSLPAVVVLIDGYAAFAAEHGDAAGLSVLDDVARVFADGTGVGIHLAVAADRIGALPMALVALARQRLLLQLADPHDYAIAGVSARSLPTFSPGRAVDAVTGREVQIARSRVALRDAVATIAAARPAPVRAPAGVGVLQQAVDIAAIGAAQLGSRPWRLPVGLGERALAPAGFSLFGGEHALVAGPGRSGRSTTLRVISQVACEADALVVTVAGPRSPLRATYGPGDAHRAAAEVLASDRPAILLVDDAELVDDPSGALAGLVEGHDPRVAVIAAGRADVLRSAYTHWTRAIRRSKAGLLLQPNVDLDGELVGVTLPRRAPVALGAGRGWLVSGADLDVVQVAT